MERKELRRLKKLNLRSWLSSIIFSGRQREAGNTPSEDWKLLALLLMFPLFITFNFHFEIKGAIFSPLEGIILILIFLSFFRRRLRYFKERLSLPYLLSWAAFILPVIPARFFIIKFTGSWVEITWRVFRNLFELIPFIFVLAAAHIRKRQTAKKIVILLLVVTSLASVMGVIQCLSDGKYLTGVGVYGNFGYLGLFPQLPAKLFLLAEMNLGKISVITHTPDSNIFRAHGTLSSHNYFAAFLVMTLCLTLGLAFFDRRKKILYSLLALPQVGALILTFSRAALIGCGLGLGVLLVMTKINFKNLITILLLFLLILGALEFGRPDLMDAFMDRTITFATLTTTKEVEARSEAWHLSVKGIAKKPAIGHGTGALKDFTLSGVPLSSHNDYLDVFYARGIVALLGWLMILLLVLRDSFSLFKKEENSFFKGFGAGVFCGLLGLMATGISQPIIQAEDSGTLVWLCFGLVVALRSRQMRQISKGEG